MSSDRVSERPTQLWKPHPDDAADVREAMASADRGEFLSPGSDRSLLDVDAGQRRRIVARRARITTWYTRQFGRLIKSGSERSLALGRTVSVLMPLTSCPVCRISRRWKSQSDERGCVELAAETSGYGTASTNRRSYCSPSPLNHRSRSTRSRAAREFVLHRSVCSRHPR